MQHSPDAGSHDGISGRSGEPSGYRPRLRVSKTYFPGAKTFFYYRGDNKPEFIYANRDVTREGAGTARLLWLFLFIPILAIVIFGLFSTVVKIPGKVTGYKDLSIRIDDRADVLSDSEEENLADKFEVFQYKTGITPALITVNDEDWIRNYDELEHYAYDLYVNTFEDEYHWLFVYSQPKVTDAGSDDWFWEGIQGDQTDGILTARKTTIFNNSVQRKLLKDDCTVGDAFSEAVNDLNGTVMDAEISLLKIPPFLIAIAIIVFGMFVAIDFHPFRARKFKKMVDCSGEIIKQEACEYCGGIYIVGHHTSCPYCQAPVKPHDFTVDGDGKITGIIK